MPRQTAQSGVALSLSLVAFITQASIDSYCQKQHRRCSRGRIRPRALANGNKKECLETLFASSSNKIRCLTASLNSEHHKAEHPLGTNVCLESNRPEQP